MTEQIRGGQGGREWEVNIGPQDFFNYFELRKYSYVVYFGRQKCCLADNMLTLFFFIDTCNTLVKWLFRYVVCICLVMLTREQCQLVLIRNTASPEFSDLIF